LRLSFSAPRAGLEELVAAPKPVFRQLPAEIYCTLGWIYGTFHVPPEQSLPEYLARSGASVNLTRVRIPRETEPLGFVALRRESISIIAPSLSGGPMPAARTEGVAAREIACLLADSMVRGTVGVPLGRRLSDFLRDAGPFLTVRHAMQAPYGATLRSPDARTFETAFVNLTHVAGVSETS
jgi:hypothetical protein